MNSRLVQLMCAEIFDEELILFCVLKGDSVNEVGFGRLTRDGGKYAMTPFTAAAQKGAPQSLLKLFLIYGADIDLKIKRCRNPNCNECSSYPAISTLAYNHKELHSKLTKDYSAAMYEIAKEFYDSHKNEDVRRKAFSVMQQHAKTGPQFYELSGYCHKMKNYQQAISYSQLAEKDLPEAKSHLGNLYSNPESGDKYDLKLAVKYLKEGWYGRRSLGVDATEEIRRLEAIAESKDSEVKNEALHALVEIYGSSSFAEYGYGLHHAREKYDRMTKKPQDWQVFFEGVDEFQRVQASDIPAAIRALQKIGGNNPLYSRTFWQSIEKDGPYLYGPVVQALLKKEIKEEPQKTLTEGVAAYFGLGKEPRNGVLAIQKLQAASSKKLPEASFWYALVLIENRKVENILSEQYQDIVILLDEANAGTRPATQVASENLLKSLQQLVKAELIQSTLNLCLAREKYRQGLSKKSETNFAEASKLFEEAHELGEERASFLLAELDSEGLPVLNVQRAIHVYKFLLEKNKLKQDPEKIQKALKGLDDLQGFLSPAQRDELNQFTSAYRVIAQGDKLKKLFVQWYNEPKKQNYEELAKQIIAIRDDKGEMANVRQHASFFAALTSVRESALSSSQQKKELAQYEAIYSKTAREITEGAENIEAMKNLAIIRYVQGHQNRSLFWAFLACIYERVSGRNVQARLMDFYPDFAVVDEKRAAFYEAMLNKGMPTSLEGVRDYLAGIEHCQDEDGKKRIHDALNKEGINRDNSSVLANLYRRFKRADESASEEEKAFSLERIPGVPSAIGVFAPAAAASAPPYQTAARAIMPSARQ